MWAYVAYPGYFIQYANSLNNFYYRNGHLSVWQCSLSLNQLTSVESTNNKRLKLNDDEEDEIDLSKGEDRERYITNKEGTL